jgi:hypothetical protein
VEIYANMRKDIDQHLKLERELEEKLDGLQKGKAAHDKAGIQKELNRTAKETAAWIDLLASHTFHCSTEGCQNLAVPISFHEGALECNICSQMLLHGMREHRTFVCGEECRDRDDNFVSFRKPYLPSHTN